MSTRLNELVRALGAANRVVVSIEKVILIVLMAGMVVFGFLQVFSRFILRAPIGWSEELLTYSFVWASFVGAGLAIYTDAHFSVDLMTRHFSPRLLKAVYLLIWILVCLFSLFLLWMGVRLAIANTIQRMNILPVSMFWAYLAVPVSGSCMFLHALEKTVEVALDIESVPKDEA